jgi:uncharacterized membrane protein YhaH (DUF805 family)
MPGEIPIATPSPGQSHATRWPRLSAALDRTEDSVRRALKPLRPRVSLSCGGVMVLITLLLPIGYESCGPKTKGYELLQGHGAWPTFMGISLENYFGRPFYAVLLALAALTMILVLISFVQPNLWKDRARTRRLFMISACLSLFLMTDAFSILPVGAGDASPWAIALIVLSCVAPVVAWPRKFSFAWLGSMALIVAACLILDSFDSLPGKNSPTYMVSIWLIYGLSPLCVWIALKSGRFRDQRASVRLALAAFYLPVGIGNLWFYEVAWKEGIPGFIPCSLGLFMMAIGYSRAASEAATEISEPSRAEASPP